MTKNWIQDAVNPKHKGYCTPMTKKTCTPHREALAKRFKSGDLSKKENGGRLSKDYISKHQKGRWLERSGRFLKNTGQYISESLSQFGMNIPFDAIRDVGVKLPSWMPTGYQGSYGSDQTVGQFAGNLVNNAGTTAAVDMGFGLVGAGVKAAVPYLKKGVKDAVPHLKKGVDYGLEQARPYLMGEQKIPGVVSPVNYFVKPTTPEGNIKFKYKLKEPTSPDKWRPEVNYEAPNRIQAKDAKSLLEQVKAREAASGKKPVILPPDRRGMEQPTYIPGIESSWGDKPTDIQAGKWYSDIKAGRI